MRLGFSRRRVLRGLGAVGLVGCGARKGPGKLGDTWDTGGIGSTPAADGFAVPAESDPHVGCLMQFPPPTNYCSGGSTDCALIERAREEWANTAKTIARFEPVALYAAPDDVATAKALCGSDVTVLEAALSDGWSRDTGPILVRNSAGVLRATCFAFNGWGGSVDAWEDDAVIKWRMAADLGVATYDHAMVLESGAVMVDGAGTLITTEECLLHDTRNPDLSQSEQEQILKDYLGVTRVIWLENGWVPDPITNGHIDGICSFVSPGVVLLNTIDDRSDPNYDILESARTRLEEAGITVIGLPATSWTAYHINFYLANGAVIVPIEGKASVDDEPLGIIGEAFPDREIVGVEANALGRSGGGVHCITQQVPEGVDWPF